MVLKQKNAGGWALVMIHELFINSRKIIVTLYMPSLWLRKKKKCSLCSNSLAKNKWVSLLVFNCHICFFFFYLVMALYTMGHDLTTSRHNLNYFQLTEMLPRDSHTWSKRSQSFSDCNQLQFIRTTVNTELLDMPLIKATTVVFLVKSNHTVIGVNTFLPSS